MININTRNGSGRRADRRPQLRLVWARRLDARAITQSRKRIAGRRLAQRARQPRSGPAELRLPAQRVQQREPVPALHAADRAELLQSDGQPFVPDVPDPDRPRGGQPASTDDVETQEDLFTSVQFRHPIGDHGSLSFGPSYKRSRIRDFGDPSNDFTFGEAGNPGAPTDCANALCRRPVVNGIVTNPVGSGNYGNMRFLAQRRPHRDRRRRQPRLRQPQPQPRRRVRRALQRHARRQDVCGDAAARKLPRADLHAGDARRAVHRGRQRAERRPPRGGLRPGLLEDGDALAARLRPARRLVHRSPRRSSRPASASSARG